jgi:chromatin remodeling complex protein RSC6
MTQSKNRRVQQRKSENIVEKKPRKAANSAVNKDYESTTDLAKATSKTTQAIVDEPVVYSKNGNIDVTKPVVDVNGKTNVVAEPVVAEPVVAEPVVQPKNSKKGKTKPVVAEPVVQPKNSKKTELVVQPKNSKKTELLVQQKKGKKTELLVQQKKGKKTELVVEPVVQVKKGKKGKKVNEEAVSTDDLPTRKKRVVPSTETVEAEFTELVDIIALEIDRRREVSSNKPNGVKFLRTINKRLKIIKSRSIRVMKKKKTRPRSNNANSGFLKPVNISAELAEFTGWEHDIQVSRVQVTKHLCEYIKKHDLQNPEDRRRILPDKKLAALLSYDSSTATKPLFYYSMQTHLKPHFVKIDEESKSV